MRDLRLGDELPTTRVEIGLWQMKVFSLLMRDPNPVHFDPQFVSATGKGSLPINQGTLNLAYPLNAIIAWLDAPGSAAAIRGFRCRFGGNVFEGDVLTVGGRVAEVVDGLARLELWMDRQTGDRVLTGEATVSLNT